MPTYDYVCDGCQHTFEAFESIKADPQTVCPSCSEPKLRRKIEPRPAEPRFLIGVRGLGYRFQDEDLTEA